MKKGLIFLIVLTMVFTFLATSQAEASIVVCSSLEQYRNEALQEQLNLRFPEYNIVVMYMSTGKAASKIFSEGSDTEVDMLVGLETGYLNKISHHLADISHKSKIPYSKGVTPEENGNRWVIWERQAGAIIVNREVLEKCGLESPRTYEDLLKPEYKDLVAMPDPKSSGTGYFFYKNWVNTWGDEKTQNYVDALYVNLKQFTESGSGPIKLLKQGEIAVGLALTFQAVSEINNGQPFEIIYPPEGSPFSLTGTAIIDGHQTKEGVDRVYDFIINEFLLYDKEHFSPEIIYEGQDITLENYPVKIQYADMTGIQDDKEKERLLALWKY